MKKDFEKWVQTFTKTIANYKFYTNFEAVYKEIERNKQNLQILNSLIGSNNIEEDFKTILINFPEIKEALPLLLAIKNTSVYIMELESFIEFDNKKSLTNAEIEKYIKFMKNTGLFELLQSHLINNIIDYVTGILVGLDSNARKNRVGNILEIYVEQYLKQNNYNYEKDYQILKGISKTRFDYIVKTKEKTYALETSYISTPGSKISELLRHYKELVIEAKQTKNIEMVFIIDGQGWIYYKKGLEELCNLTDYVYNINDLKNNRLQLN